MARGRRTAKPPTHRVSPTAACRRRPATRCRIRHSPAMASRIRRSRTTVRRPSGMHVQPRRRHPRGCSRTHRWNVNALLRRPRSTRQDRTRCRPCAARGAASGRRADSAGRAARQPERSATRPAATAARQHGADSAAASAPRFPVAGPAWTIATGTGGTCTATARRIRATGAASRNRAAPCERVPSAGPAMHDMPRPQPQAPRMDPRPNLHRVWSRDRSRRHAWNRVRRCPLRTWNRGRNRRRTSRHLTRATRRRKAVTKSGIASKRRNVKQNGPTGISRSGHFYGRGAMHPARPGLLDQTAIGAVSGSWWR